MEVQMELGQIITIATVIFSAGIVYGKIKNLEKKLDEMNDHAERLTALETKLQTLKPHI